MITDEMRAIVGVVMEEETSYPIAASDIRRWALAVYYPELPPPEFWDEEDPVTVALGGLVAPDEFNPLAWIRRIRNRFRVVPVRRLRESAHSK